MIPSRVSSYMRVAYPTNSCTNSEEIRHKPSAKQHRRGKRGGSARPQSPQSCAAACRMKSFRVCSDGHGICSPVSSIDSVPRPVYPTLNFTSNKVFCRQHFGTLQNHLGCRGLGKQCKHVCGVASGPSFLQLRRTSLAFQVSLTHKPHPAASVVEVLQLRPTWYETEPAMFLWIT